MKANYTDIIGILDRSGSMKSMQRDTEGGFNTFMEEQKKLDGECTATLYQFDTKHEIVYDTIPVSEVPPLNLVPRGGTALLDALGTAIASRGEKYAAMSEEDRPEHVVFVVITDGEENSSKEYTHDQVKSMIEHQQEAYGWTFVYLGANQDAITVAASYGIAAASAMTYTKSGVGSTYSSASAGITKMRSTGMSISFSDTDRQTAITGNDTN